MRRGRAGAVRGTGSGEAAVRRGMLYGDRRSRLVEDTRRPPRCDTLLHTPPHSDRLGTKGQTEGQTEGRRDGRRDGGTDGRRDGGTEGRTEGQRDGGTEGQTEGRRDGGTERGSVHEGPPPAPDPPLHRTGAHTHTCTVSMCERGRAYAASRGRRMWRGGQARRAVVLCAYAASRGWMLEDARRRRQPGHAAYLYIILYCEYNLRKGLLTPFAIRAQRVVDNLSHCVYAGEGRKTLTRRGAKD